MRIEWGPTSLTFKVNGTPEDYRVGDVLRVAGVVYRVVEAEFDDTDPVDDTEGNRWPGMWTVSVVQAVE